MKPCTCGLRKRLEDKIKKLEEKEAQWKSLVYEGDIRGAIPLSVNCFDFTMEQLRDLLM